MGIEPGLERVGVLRCMHNHQHFYELQPFTSAPVYARFYGFL